MMYKHMFISPLLADPATIDPRNDYGAATKYELRPAMLRTCRQIYNEASPFLYEGNTFVIFLLTDGYSRYSSRYSEPLSTTPLMRKTGREILEEIPALHKIRHWKIVISPFAGHEPALMVTTFARAVRKVSLKTLDIQVIGQKSCEAWGSEEFMYIKTQNGHFIGNVLDPLEILRGIEKVDLQQEHARLVFPMIKERLVKLLMSNKPVLYVPEMYTQLVAYAQAFERNDDYKKAMALEDHVRRHYDLRPWKWSADATSQIGFFQQVMELDLFKTAVTHPVEKALELAKFAGDEVNSGKFKTQRKIILLFLEPQYQRITAARALLKEFVDKQTHYTGALGEGKCFFEKEHWEVVSTLARENIFRAIQGTLLLESYAKAFTRDLTPDVAVIIRLHQESFDARYADLPREQLLRKLSKAVSLQDWVSWQGVFKKVVDDMEEQYLCIEKARKALFDFDVADRGCDIDIDSSKSDERISWEDKMALARAGMMEETILHPSA